MVVSLYQVVTLNAEPPLTRFIFRKPYGIPTLWMGNRWAIKLSALPMATQDNTPRAGLELSHSVQGWCPWWPQLHLFSVENGLLCTFFRDCGITPQWRLNQLNFSRNWDACVCAKSLQLCPTLWNSMGCRLPGSACPWDSPGKNTGVGCHAFLQK